jgi:hypothetical protein
MAKLTVWECDHCAKTFTSPEMPEKWVEAQVYSEYKPQSSKYKTYIWCETCWRIIQTPIPRAG